MSQKENDVHPVRRRAGLLSALAKLYTAVRGIVENEGTAEEALTVQRKLNERYVAYLECHEIALVAVPERENSLNESHIGVDQRHQEAVDVLQAYIDDGTKSERSLHIRSLFSSESSRQSVASVREFPIPNRRSGSQASKAKSDSRLSEARVEAELAKKNVEQFKALRDAQQRKLELEREAARQQIELEKEESRKRLERKEADALRRIELEEETHRANLQRQLLKEETERQQRELDHEIEMQKRIAEMERLKAEVNIREREDLRSVLGSDLDSDEEHEDVTNPKDVTRPILGFQDNAVQQSKMLDILRSYTEMPVKMPATKTEGDAVSTWLRDSVHGSKYDAPLVPRNTPSDTPTGYIPQTGASRKFDRQVIADTPTGYIPQTGASRKFDRQAIADTRQTQKVLEDVKFGSPVRRTNDTVSYQEKSDAALFSRALRDSRLPQPKILTFDGDSKKYKMFMASFQSNVEEMLDDDDYKMKLTLLLQHCTGKALELIEDCVMLPPHRGYATALEKLEKWFGRNHHIARSYINSVTKGGAVKLNDVEALTQLALDMGKCQTVLSELRFTSDLDSTGTILSIVRRLPDSFQTQWVRRSTKILNTGREATFHDLTKFVEERAEEFNSLYGQSYADDHNTSKSKPLDHGAGKPRDKRRKFTTLATSTDRDADSTAGQETATACASTSTSHDTKKKACAYCERAGHFISTCFKFKKLDLTQKQDVVKKNNLCFCCLRTGHGSGSCDRVCSKCSKKHHYHLHEEKTGSNKSVNEKTAAAGMVASTTFKDRGRASLGVLRVRAQSDGKEVVCWALVDSGSNTTFIKRNVADKLGLRGPEHIYSVNTIGGPSTHDEMCVDFDLASEDGSKAIQVVGAFTIPSLNIRAKYDGTAHSKWEHLADLDFPKVNEEIDIVIGTDCTEMFWAENERRAGRKDPYARETLLGWILLGPTDERWTFSANAATIEPLQAAYDRMLMADFEDVKCKDPVMSVDDKRALKVMQETVHMSGGKFCVGIPWKINPEEALQNNRSMSESRLRMLKRKFEANPKLADDYTKTVEAYISDGHAAMVEESELNTVHQWYLPHHAVFKRSNPEKCRVVFDCAAQFKGVSLNDVILQGPNFLNNLSGVLVRFRKEPVAVVGDIKLMFHQCFVLENERKFLRFLWWPNGDIKQKPRVYCMKVHLFGGKSSPSVVNFCMRHIADENERRFSELSIDTLRRAFYMDDMICSVSSNAEAKQLIVDMKGLLKTGGFELAKFMSTSREVIESVPEEDRAKSLQNIDLQDNTLPQESALGLKWNVEGDYFTYTVNLQEKPLTKRGLLSTTASLYDPLGLVAPVLLVPKLVQQNMCRLEMEWDDDLTDEGAAEFCDWREKTEALSGLKIPRCFQDGPSTESDRELHVFCDASEYAYGAAAYLKVTTESNVTVSLVMGKSRVAPLKMISIPRLELTAATVAAKVAQFLLDEFDFDDISVFFWTDSMTVLRYLRNVSTRFKIFVAHRVQQIQDATDINSWNYVPTDRNPADLASRGISPDDSVKLDFWLNGPSFLKETSDYNRLFEEPLSEKLELEVRQTCATETFVDVAAFIRRYSSIYRLQRAVCWLIKFLEHVQGKKVDAELHVENMEQALRNLIKFSQKCAFQEEIKALGSDKEISRSSKIQKLCPVLINGVLCVGGRLDNAGDEVVKHPVILANDYLTTLLVRDAHERNAHAGSNYVLTQLRRKYHLLKGYSTVKSVLSSCIACKKHHGLPMQQVMGDLPKERTDVTKPPFTYVGVDYFGPMNVKYRRGTVKRYGCIFTCLTTRAVHIEVAHALNSDSFLMALHRFIARRGKPQKIFSDNGTNFVGADSELSKEIRAVNSSKLKGELLLEAIEWSFNPPHAPHMGGAWERLIRSVKDILRHLVGDRLLTDEELASFMCEVEKIMNDRPLTRMGSDARDPTPLTPNHLLLMKGNSCAPNTDANHVRRRWQIIQGIANRFYERFLSEYIPQLQIRSKWTSEKENLKIDDLVLIMEDDSPRGQWPMGIVSEIEHSADGRVRSATIRCKDKEKRRPIHKLVLLERHDS